MTRSPQFSRIGMKSESTSRAARRYELELRDRLALGHAGAAVGFGR
jgi:hypothetical protein